MRTSITLPNSKHSEEPLSTDETQTRCSHRNASNWFVRQASPRLPPHLLPVAAFSAFYPKYLSTRSFSADQSVTSRLVSDSTTSYPSMGFVPLQDATACSLWFSCPSLDALPETRHTFQCDRGEFITNQDWLAQPLSTCARLLTPTSHNPFHSYSLKKRETRFSIWPSRCAVHITMANKGQIEVYPNKLPGANTISRHLVIHPKTNDQV